MSERVSYFSEIQEQFSAYLSEIVFSTMSTVDTRGRPRTRILIAVWEIVEDGPVGWIATHRTPVKSAHLANNPHATLSYWCPSQNAVAIDTVAEWVDDPEVKRHVWELYRKGSPDGVGDDLSQYWKDGYTNPKLQVLRLRPWRIQVTRGTDLKSWILKSGVS